MDMKQKILIVEDEPEIAELIRMHMDRNGFQTTVVHSGKAGIDEIARSMPDCVLRASLARHGGCPWLWLTTVKFTAATKCWPTLTSTTASRMVIS